MGQQQSRNSADTNPIMKCFESLEELQKCLSDQGLKEASLVVGIDFSGSNRQSGMNTFKKNLHTLSEEEVNPYIKVMDIIGRTLQPYDDDGLIQVYGFGDKRTTDRSVFNLKTFITRQEEIERKKQKNPNYDEDSHIRRKTKEKKQEDTEHELNDCFIGMTEAIEGYKQVVPKITLSGPTSFAPLLQVVKERLKSKNEYTILAIITDGKISDIGTNRKEIEEISKYPVSIICIGVGDGPYDLMEAFDDSVKSYKFDNFNFVDFEKTMKEAEDKENKDAYFSCVAMSEIPDQYKYIVDHHYLDDDFVRKMTRDDDYSSTSSSDDDKKKEKKDKKEDDKNDSAKTSEEVSANVLDSDINASTTSLKEDESII